MATKKMGREDKQIRLEVCRTLAMDTRFSLELAKVMSKRGGIGKAIKAIKQEFEIPSRTRVRKRPKVPQPIVTEYKVFVDYVVPSMSDLKKDYPEGRVSWLFDGRPWKLHDSCELIDRTPGEREFGVFHFNQQLKSDSAIKEADTLGWRPATHEEAVAFAKAHPDL